MPESFQPEIENNDGEVSGFQLIPVKEIVTNITFQVNVILKILRIRSTFEVDLCRQDYKLTSPPIAFDWLVRRRHVILWEEPDLPEIVELLHLPLHSLFF